jgi:Na+/H+-translocating membrane pyrophosphatase
MHSVRILARSILLVVIGTLFSSIESTNVYGAIDSFQKKVDIVTDSKHKNDCDEHDAGANNADCSNVDETATDQISMIGKNNKFISNSN